MTDLPARLIAKLHFVHTPELRLNALIHDNRIHVRTSTSNASQAFLNSVILPPGNRGGQHPLFALCTFPETGEGVFLRFWRRGRRAGFAGHDAPKPEGLQFDSLGQRPRCYTQVANISPRRGV